MGVRLKQTWDRLTAARPFYDDSARQEYMTCVVLVIMAGVCLFFTLVVIAGWLAGMFSLIDPLTMLAVMTLIIIGWQLANSGQWRISRYIPPLIFFSLGVYGSATNGLRTTFVLSYATAIVLAAMLLEEWLTWLMVAATLLLHLSVGQRYDQGSIIVFFTRAIPFSSFTLGITALFLFAMRLLKFALNDTRRSATKLQAEIFERERAQHTLLKRNQELRLLNHIIATASSLEIQDILQITIRELTIGLGFSQAGVALLMPDRTHLKVVAEYPDGRSASALGKLIPIKGNISIQYVIERREPLAIIDVQNDARMAVVKGLLSLRSVASIMLLPLIVHDQVLGTISLDSHERREFTQQEIDLASNAALAIAQAIENAQLYAKVQRLAIHDELTDLLNRRGLYEFGQREFERACRFKRGLAVVFMDVDNFKMVNDRYGHAGGDQLLYGLGGVIRNSVREIDLVSRFGGDEFIVLLTEASVDQASDVGDRLRLNIANASISAGSERLNTTVSLGVAMLTSEIISLEALVERADQALYKAKQLGGNQLVVA